ncbi:MAG TPA: hypothetical protein VLJ10_05750 [Candidatus Bathyarchaeia archaeon]|nr:hypothetical protein [Candidatus Bathyarchaeia archaeon]
MATWNSECALPGPVKKIFLPFARKLVEVYGDDLHSIFLFGSATGENFISGRSDINSVVVLNKVGAEDLSKALVLIASVRRLRIAAPLFMTEAHIKSSLDVFPIEFMDMQANYMVVYGNDFLKDLVIGTEHVRLFCEQQIKGKLIRIRQAFLEVGMSARNMERLLGEAMDSLIPVFRGLLKTKGISPSVVKEEIISQMGSSFGIASDAFLVIWQNKKTRSHFDRQQAAQVFATVIEQLELLAGIVDRL